MPQLRGAGLYLHAACAPKKLSTGDRSSGTTRPACYGLQGIRGQIPCDRESELSADALVSLLSPLLAVPWCFEGYRNGVR